MKSRYRKGFYKLAVLLNEIREDPENSAETCLTLQKLMINKIRRVESRIRELKNLPTKDENTLSLISEYQEIGRLIRSFGDAVAHIFMDRWDIKPISRGNSPGFISGKKGFVFEFQMLQQSSELGVPSLLADLTNCLRHGDLYIFSPNATHPLIMELKTSKKSGGSRAARQAKRNNKTFEYLNSDVGDYKGSLMMRRALSNELVDYSDKVNDLSDIALTEGHASDHVSRGIWCMAYMSGEFEPLVEKTLEIFSHPLYTDVNADAYTNRIDTYYPIALILKDPITLSKFMVGDFVLMIILDLAEIEKAKNGSIEKIEFHPDQDYALSVHLKNVPAPMQVSRNMFSRIFFEFCNLDWFIEHLADSKRHIDDYLATEKSD